MMWRSILSLLFLAETITLSAAEPPVPAAPVVVWASAPVKPGETVLVHGGNFGPHPVVELTSGQQKQTVTPISVSDSALMFVYPEAWQPGVVSGIVRSGNLTSKPFQLNAPDAWWIQGDRGREASPQAGSVSVFGNCLADSGKFVPELALRRLEDGTQVRAIRLDVSKYNHFSVRSVPWRVVPAGQYEVLLKRSGDSKEVAIGKIKISEKENKVPRQVFNVVDFGAIPNDKIDDTPAILAAAAKLKENGGGTLFFPRGRFQMTATIELPANSVLRGMGADQSQIYWPDTFEPLDALIRGTHSFEVADIFLTCGNHKDGIVGNWPEPAKKLTPEEQAAYKCGNITVRNVTLRMLYSQYINDNLDELKRRLPTLHYARALRLGGENINVTGNDIYCSAGGVFELRGYWSNVSDNRFCRGNIIGWNGFSGRQLIFADNHLGGANCTSFYGLPEGAENIYWGNNYHENNFDGNNRETLTGDGRIHAYMDTVTDITSTTFTLRDEPKWRGGVLAWEKGAVQIAGGKGVGQLRRIKRIDGVKVELESPWDIVPDESSVFNIGSFRRRFIYTENRVHDATVALQFYGSMIEGVVAHNETSRTGGYNGDAMAGEANWFNQFLNNTIVTGNSYRGPRNEVPALDAQLGLLAYGTGIDKHKYPLVRSCVVRNNRLGCAAKLNVMGWVVDSVLEKNQVENTAVGTTIAEAATNIVLRNNNFRGVGTAYEYNPQSVVIRPAEEMVSALHGVATLVGWKSTADMPGRWQEILANKDLAGANSENVAGLWEKAVQAFAESNAGKPITDKVVETLLGVKVLTPNWRTAYPGVRDGRAGNFPLLVRIPGSRVKAHLKLRLQPEDLPQAGWSFTIPECDLEPGKIADLHATLTKPEGKARMLSIPLRGELVGAGWKLAFATIVTDPWDMITIDKFKVSPPLLNPLGKQARLGYIKYEQIPKTAKDQLRDAPMEFGRFALASLFADAADEGKVIFGIAAVKSKSPVQVKFEFSNNCLLFVNGKIVGTTLGRGQWGFVQMEEGENIIELIMLPSKRDEWRFGLPRITWVEKALVLE